MDTHVRDLLYDYVRHELPTADQESVETHLRRCAECRTAEAEIREMAGMLDAISPLRHGSPSAARSEEFWATFAARVDARITREAARHSSPLTRLFDKLAWSVAVHRKSAVAAGSALAFAVVALIIFLVQPRPTDPSAFFASQDSAGRQSVALEPATGERGTASAERSHEETELSTDRSASPRMQYAGGRVEQYLRRSKMLLIGIVNMDTDHPVDLSVEGRTSRQLIQEARYLRERPLDPEAADLIDQLDRILIQLSAMAEKRKAPNVEILRGGIHQENLLFKIRMAEAVLDTARGTGKNTTSF